MSALILIGMAQCKKKTESLITPDYGETTKIELNINNGNRLDVNPVTGVVRFTTGDVIYVASNGKYVGQLQHNGTNFTGSITGATNGAPLYFYFLGNKTPQEELTVGTTATFTVDIMDQATSYPVISAAPSVENYSASTYTYTATLLNKCALVKFTVTAPSSDAVVAISGVNNMMTITLAADGLGTFTPGMYRRGEVRLNGTGSERWAILLAKPTESGDGESYTVVNDKYYTGTRAALPAITDNGYLTDGYAVNVNTEEYSVSHAFTVNNAGKKVRMAKSNLQYHKGYETWSFMENPWTMIEYPGPNIGDDYSNQSIVSLFGYGTSGYNHGATNYMPYKTLDNNALYNIYGSVYMDLEKGNGTADHGCNMGAGGWRTPTQDEWGYLLFSRSTMSNVRYAKAIVNDVNGLIILPDDWNTSYYALNETDDKNSCYSSNNLTSADWTNYFETNGAVFLPAAGTRDNTTIIFYQEDGDYATNRYNHSNWIGKYTVSFGDGWINNTYDLYRSRGSSVRLVVDE